MMAFTTAAIVFKEASMPGFKSVGPAIGSFTFVGEHPLISPLDTKVRYPQPANAGPLAVYASLDLRTPEGVPIDIDGKSPPLNNRDQVYLIDDARPNSIGSYALRQDGSFIPTPIEGHTDQDLLLATQTAGYNAANEVSALGQTALQQAAAKYPKP
jgi:hypothetical protein